MRKAVLLLHHPTKQFCCSAAARPVKPQYLPLYCSSSRHCGCGGLSGTASLALGSRLSGGRRSIFSASSYGVGTIESTRTTTRRRRKEEGDKRCDSGVAVLAWRRAFSSPSAASSTAAAAGLGSSSSGANGSNKGDDGSDGHPLDPKQIEALIALWEEERGGDCTVAKEIGLRYLNHGGSGGRSKERDLEESIRWLQRATTTTTSNSGGGGDGEAWYALALAYERADTSRTSEIAPEEEEEVEIVGGGETYGAKSGVELVRIIRTKANKKKKERLAQGLVLPHGLPLSSVPVAHRRSLPCLEKAAQLRHIDAMVHAGNVYFDLAQQAAAAPVKKQQPEPPSPPSGQSKEEEEAAAAVVLMRHAVSWWEAGDEQGQHSDAAFNLGTLYYEGGPGVAVDPGHAVAYLHKAAERGDASAIYWLGHAYRTGDAGLAQDGARAVSLLREACEQHQHPAACYYLAMLYREGDPSIGIPQADPQAFRTYLAKAEQLGDPDALYCLADMHMHGTDGVDGVDVRRAMELYEKAGRAGQDEALVCLGAIHHHRGDYQQAFSVYQRAADRGSEAAWRNLASMYALGQGTEKNEAMAQHILRTIRQPQPTKDGI